MGLFDWLTSRNKSLSEMTRQELRRQELLLDRERKQLHGRIEDAAKKKQEIFERGRQEKSPEIRKMLAQEFDLRTTEQLMSARQLNIRSKEYLTVSRMRMLKESSDKAKARGSSLGLIGERDMIALEKMIENDSVTAEMYQDRLDSLLQIGADESESVLTPGSKQVLDVWEQMDTGLISDSGQAFDEADRRVRERHKENRAAE
jgi:uncharacterized membrane protein